MKGLSLSVQKKVYDSLKINFFFRSLLNRIFFLIYICFWFLFTKTGFSFYFCSPHSKTATMVLFRFSKPNDVVWETKCLKNFSKCQSFIQEKKVEFFKRHFQTWCLLMAVWFFMATYGIANVVYLANHNFYLKLDRTNFELIFNEFLNYFSPFESMQLQFLNRKNFKRLWFLII